MLISVGFGNYVNTGHLTAVCHADSAPMKRMAAEARTSGMAVDATQGRKTKAVLVMKDGHVVLSALMPETIAARMNGQLSESRDGNTADTAGGITDMEDAYEE